MKTTKIILSIAAMALLTLTVQAQPGGTGGFDDEPVDVPVDGGIALLAIAGVAYGFKKLKK
jgi:hypothetical protein